MIRKEPLILFVVITLLISSAAVLAQGNDPPALQTGPGAANTMLGTAFNFQGSLAQAGQAANGVYAFEFRLFDASVNGNQVGSPLAKSVQVSQGLFAADLDFGASRWDGAAYFLQIGVRSPGGAGPYTILSPRQPLAAVPYALALPGLQTRQNATSPNLIGGYSGNVMGAGVTGGVIAGGGMAAQVNSVYDTGATVGGGIVNRAGTNDNDTTKQSYATVGGGSYNTASGNLATVGGGSLNTASTSSTTVSGGFHNTASGNYAAVGGGTQNDVGGSTATVCGGSSNNASGQGAAVGGGQHNQAGGKDSVISGGSTNQAAGPNAAVGGGQANHASGQQASVGGGGQNLASGNSSTVGGGSGNVASSTGGAVCGGENNIAGDMHSTVAGGKDNGAVKGGAAVGGGLGNVVSAAYGVIAGGEANDASGDHATVSGGKGNVAGANRTAVGGGESNYASGDYAAIGGGLSNQVMGDYAAIPGGWHNKALSNYSFAAGRGANAVHTGAFVWADSAAASFSSTKDNQFAIRAAGGVQLASVAGSSTSVAVGDHYRDNGIFAWGRISSNGALENDFGVASVLHIAPGVYEITMTAQVSQAGTLIPVAMPEIDGPPNTASDIRIASIDHGNVVANERTMFRVYINRGSGPLVDNDFVFIVTGR